MGSLCAPVIWGPYEISVIVLTPTPGTIKKLRNSIYLKKKSKILHDLDFDCVLFKFVSSCTSTALAIFSSPHGTYMSDLLFYHRPQTCIESKVLPLGQNDPTFVSGTITSNESWISSCYSEAKQNFSGWVSNVLVWKWHMKSWTFIHSWGYGTEILSTTVRQAMQSSTVMAVWQYSCHWLKLWHNPSFIEKILFFSGHIDKTAHLTYQIFIPQFGPFLLKWSSTCRIDKYISVCISHSLPLYTHTQCETNSMFLEIKNL